MTFTKLFKISSLTGMGIYTGFVLHQNDWNVRHIGLVRFGVAAFTAVSIAVDYKTSVSKLQDSTEITLQKWSDCHRRSAERLLNLCSINGGVFIKVGQHIAALEHLVPPEYVETLKVLHNQAPRSKITAIKLAIQKEIGQSFDDIFAEFEEEPIASASLAQVYRAKLKAENAKVAVKVQHPQVFKHSLVDIATMEFLARTINRLFPEYSFIWLVEETKKNLPLEMDFVHEGKNSELVGPLLKEFSWLKIPKIYWKYTTKRVLVMEFIDGRLITDNQFFVSNKINTRLIANRFEDIYNKMIYTYGTIHCDPHPGNVMVKKHPNDNDFDLYLLDHGLYTYLTDDFRQNYCSMLLAIMNGDIDQIKNCANEMGISDEDAALLSCMISAKPWSSVSKGLSNRSINKETIKQEKEELKKNIAIYMGSISKVLAKVDRQLLLVMKTNDLVRSINRNLGRDERSTLINMNRYCLDTVTEKRLRQTQNVWSRMMIRLNNRIAHFRLTFYSLCVWMGSLFESKAIA
ncbi:putative aarF domain-containing protein kinase 1 -like protein [Sarcoptes scabiei]|uniref:Putative aarF domain-containing protein kinase 1 -like protein n=1 Tax=Sarcoptes scabiei TaxID=52283 RepID=A0A834R4K2_SARSC|nr:putative aarF domain-containing protein kinase 1 -like protein [Sarcoptes scabiei]